MTKIKFILISAFIFSFFVISFLLYSYGYQDLAFSITLFLSFCLMIQTLRMFNFFINVLDIFSNENAYLKKTIVSFFSNLENELLRIKVSYKKKVALDKLIISEEKSKYSQLVDTIPLPIALVSKQRYVLFANKLAKKKFSENFEGSYIQNYFRDPALSEAFNKVSNNILSDTELQVVYEGTSPMSFNIKIKAVLSEESKVIYILLIFFDQSTISKSLQQRNDFLANASHELKTPLTNILGISEIISNDPSAIIENKNFSKNLLLNVKRMQNLIYSLLDLSKIEINRNIIKYKLFSLEKITKSTIDQFKKLNSNKQNIKLINNLKRKSLKLKTAEKEFKLLFFNLLDNAFKFSSSLVKIYLEETTKNIEIIFQDNGIGIPKNEINRVTERFYRVKGNEKIEGSGLGLAIVSEIMNNHEGEIKIESEEKGGTKVFLIFKRF